MLPGAHADAAAQRRSLGDGTCAAGSRPGIEAGPDIVVIRVAAPPADGRATEEARKALARAAGVPSSRVSVVRGERSRTKVFLVSGVTTVEVVSALGKAS